MKKVTADDFRAALIKEFTKASASGASNCTVNSGDLHRYVGGYPGPDHLMPSCCSVMRKAMNVDDEVLSQPKKGAGASLTIKYRLPRSIDA